MKKAILVLALLVFVTILLPVRAQSPTPINGENLLANPSLEGDYYHCQRQDRPDSAGIIWCNGSILVQEVTIPTGWQLGWMASLAQPETQPIDGRLYPGRVADGARAFKAFSTYRNYVVVLQQTVQITGTVLAQGCVSSHGWADNRTPAQLQQDPPSTNSSGNPVSTEPWGITTCVRIMGYRSPDDIVQADNCQEQLDVYETVCTVPIEITDATVYFQIYAGARYPFRTNDVYIDKAALLVKEPEGIAAGYPTYTYQAQPGSLMADAVRLLPPDLSPFYPTPTPTSNEQLPTPTPTPTPRPSPTATPVLPTPTPSIIVGQRPLSIPVAYIGDRAVYAGLSDWFLHPGERYIPVATPVPEQPESEQEQSTGSPLTPAIGVLLVIVGVVLFVIKRVPALAPLREKLRL